MIHSIFPTQDATIYEAEPTKNTGLDAILDLSKSVVSSSVFNNRVLLKFDLSTISQSIVDGLISGSTQYYINLYTIEAQEVPAEYTVEAFPISESWDSGLGRYTHYPVTTNGVSWINRSKAGVNETPWTTSSFAVNTTGSISYVSGGGTWYTNYTCSQSYDTSLTDVRINVTSIVNDWLNNTIPNNGFILKKAQVDEANATRCEILNFFSNNSQTVYSPKLEVLWDNSTFTTGSLTQVSNSKPIVIYLPNLKSAYSEQSKLNLDIRVREKYPTITFATQSNYLTTNYLPTSSLHYSIRYADNDEVVIPFDDVYTKVSCNSDGNFVSLWLDSLYPEKYYKFVFKVERSGGEEYIDNNYIFKVTK